MDTAANKTHAASSVRDDGSTTIRGFMHTVAQLRRFIVHQTTSGNFGSKMHTIGSTVQLFYSYDCRRALELADGYPETLRYR